jgi:hypothetical protein
MLSRRQFGLLSAAGLLCPRPLLASASPERKFLFVLCYGGWDTSMVFSPMFDISGADTEADATTAAAGGITFVDSGARPAVRSFFEDHGERCAVINGLEVPSVTHERCRRILMTGSTATAADDWPALLAGTSGSSLLLPHVVLAGPAYTWQHADAVIRVGSSGQLPDLLDNTAFQHSDLPVTALPPSVTALADAHLARVVAQQAAAAPAGRPARVIGGYSEVLDQLAALQDLDGVELSPEDAGCARDLAADAAAVFDLFSLGITRCAMVRNDGWCSQGWDTHQGNSLQSTHYEELFGYLNLLMADLDTRVGATGAPLSEEVTVVVISEMGRHPQLNTWGGKDHWTFTSAMIIGAGVAGGQVVGELDGDALGRRVDLASGETTDSGVALTAGHLGATLLALGDLDPATYIDDAAPIEAVLA